MSQGRAAKQAKLVKALFESMPAFPLSHACIVRDLTLPSPSGRGGVVPKNEALVSHEGWNVIWISVVL